MINTDNFDQRHYSANAERPANCELDISVRNRNIATNFDAFWQSFKDYSAGFEGRGVDWNSLYDEYAPLAATAGTDTELLQLFTRMLDQLGDDTVGVYVPEDEGFYQGRKQDVTLERLRTEPGVNIAADDSQQLDNLLTSLLNQQYWINVAYMDSPPKVAANGRVLWGIMDNRIGYIEFQLLDEIGPEIPGYLLDSQLLSSELDTILTQLADTQAIIIDLRFHDEMGDERLALQVASRFADENRSVFRKKSVYRGNVSETQTYSLGPSSNINYHGDIYVLTSSLTSGAAEVMALTLKNFPHIRIVGEPSSGDFADTLITQLPNGWRTITSNVLYEAIDGSNYEGQGVPVDFEARVLDPIARARGVSFPIEIVLMQ